MRRALIALVLIAPALILIGWLIAAQLPTWTAPQANWFPVGTPGVCSAVDSLVLYKAIHADVGGIGEAAAGEDGLQAIDTHYVFAPSNTTTVITVDGAAYHPALLGVEATLPGDQRRGYYIVTGYVGGQRLLTVGIAYVDAQTGDVKALITAIDDPTRRCDFDVKAALLAALKSPPLLLLAGYTALVMIGLIGGWLLKRRGTR